MVSLLRKIEHHLSVMAEVEHRRRNKLAAARAKRTMNDTAAITRAARAVLKESDKPVPSRILLRRLEKRGVEVKGVNPINSLRSLIWRDPFIHRTRQGYVLRKDENLATEAL